jgi:hypothetical protein
MVYPPAGSWQLGINLDYIYHFGGTDIDANNQTYLMVAEA